MIMIVAKTNCLHCRLFPAEIVGIAKTAVKMMINMRSCIQQLGAKKNKLIIFSYRGLTLWSTKRITAMAKARQPTTMYAMPRKLFFPPAHDVVERTRYL